ncbi:transcriptional regulator [Corynebacterium sp. Marseille-P4321]|uniref:transcriptional regulator n=1 Tax=Corynebacterium sp. Marseille-P4321 TaxID=2736603 RepID=UPI00089415DA|nr:transcriptional regulator [Corynebacterium sp. Marseille-P4321]OEX92104.1 MarR family transcriptional regulator [Corynebacterium sp. BCW_4722]
MSEPAVDPAIDPVIHPLTRLKICAALYHAGAVEKQTSRHEMRFGALAETAALSDSALSKQLATLEEHGYVTRFREYGSSRAKDTVWVTLTEKGRAAYEGHIAALREIAGG